MLNQKHEREETGPTYDENFKHKTRIKQKNANTKQDLPSFFQSVGLLKH